MMSFLWRERGGGVAGAVGKKVNCNLPAGVFYCEQGLNDVK